MQVLCYAVVGGLYKNIKGTNIKSNECLCELEETVSIMSYGKTISCYKLGFVTFLSTDSIAKPEPNSAAKEIYWIDFVNV